MELRQTDSGISHRPRVQLLAVPSQPMTQPVTSSRYGAMSYRHRRSAASPASDIDEGWASGAASPWAILQRLAASH